MFAALCLLGGLLGCQKEAAGPPPRTRPAPVASGKTLCGRPLVEVHDVELRRASPVAELFVPEHVGSFVIDNMEADEAIRCTFRLRGPHVRPQTVFTRYGPADRGRVAVTALADGGVVVIYPIPAHSYGLISVEPSVEAATPLGFEERGLRYAVVEGAYLRPEDHAPLFHSLGPATRIDVENTTAQASRISFILENVSDRLSEPVLTGLGDARVRRQGSLRLLVDGELAGGGKAALVLQPRPLPAEWSFVFGGDIKGELGTFMELLERVRLKTDPLFMLAAGDYTRNSLPHELAAYQDRLSQIPFPIYTIKGNHETRAQGEQHYARLFGPGRYAFEVGGVLFVVLDASRWSPEGFVIGPEQFGWLEELLSHNRQRAWKVLALHPPPHPLHGDTRRTGYPTNLAPAEAQGLRDLAVKYGVAYVLSGHAHLYARGMEVGTVYLTSGGGGARLFEHSKVPGFTIRPIRHLMVLQVGPDEIEEQLISLPRFEDEEE